MPELAFLIPSRNEQFLSKTIEDIVLHAKGDYEIIAVLDGWETELPEHPRLRVIRFKESIGQRAATNKAAAISSAKYLMKVDAHCSFDEGFDVKLIKEMQDDWTMVPLMRNLHAFDWVCPKGHRRYQGPSGPCKECGEPTTMDIKWIGKENPQSTSYCFDSEPHFQYFNKFKRRPGGKGELTETMSLQGSCFLVTAHKYWELELCGENFGSWGSQGIEVAVKTWLSGGRVVCNQKTWYAHMFRTQGGDFGFPYEQSGRQIENAKRMVREVFFNDNWPKQIKPLSWLIEKFKPVPGWHYEENKVKVIKENVEKVYKSGEVFNKIHAPVIIDHKPTIGFVYYSDGLPSKQILETCQRQIKACCNGHELISTTLVPMDFGNNKVMELERSNLTMFIQILDGISRSTADILFFVEHDIMYHPSHFNFTPSSRDIFYYDKNFWMVDAANGHALFYDHMSTSGLVAYRDLLLRHYEARVEKVRKEGFSRSFGYEPGSHKPPRGCDYYARESYLSQYSSLDIRHDRNLTRNRWRQDQFRDKKQLWNWTEKKVWEIPGWDASTLSEIIQCPIPNS